MLTGLEDLFLFVVDAILFSLSNTDVVLDYIERAGMIFVSFIGVNFGINGLKQSL